MSIKPNIDYGKTVRIPDGEYKVAYILHEVTVGSFGKKLRIDFRIVSLGNYYDVELSAWYNIVDGEVGKGGKIKLTARQNITNELYLVLELKDQADELCPSMLQGLVILVDVATVKTNSRKKTLAEPLWYSKVQCMKKRVNNDSSVDDAHTSTDSVADDEF